MKNNIQIDNSKYLSYLHEEIYEKHKNDFIKIQNEITEQLKDYPNFNGIDFCDVSAGGIQIRGHHININGYSYGDQPTIEYDFSNVDECIKQFVKKWKEYDNPDNYRLFIKFIENGEKYGWD
jgi:hypothetical protein